MNIIFSKKGDVWGPEGVTDGYTIEISWTEEEMATLQRSYDPTVGTSPATSICRPIVRQILDALKETS